MGKLNQIYLAMAFVTGAFGQSASNFDTRIITPSEPVSKEPKPARPAPAKAVTAGATVPSRYVGTAELEPYLSTLTAMFQSGGREKDPFGHYQDPDAKPIVKPTLARTSTRAAPVRATPLSEIVGLLSITTIMPGEKCFLIGTRKVKQGDQLALVFRGKQLRVQVTEVTSKLIDFRNVESSETGSRELDMLPTGMMPGSDAIKAPGMTPDRPDSPIELEMGESPP